MKKVGKLIAVMVAVVMLVSAIAIPASASSTNIITSTPLVTPCSFPTTTQELYFKLWVNNTGTASVTPDFSYDAGTTGIVPKSPMVQGNHRLYYRLTVKERSNEPTPTQVYIDWTWGVGSVNGYYAVRRASSVDACGEW